IGVPRSLGARLGWRQHLSILERDGWGEEMRLRAQDRCTHLLQWRDVEDHHGAAMRAGDELVIAWMDLEIVHRDRRQATRQREPALSLVQRRKDTCFSS